MNGWITAIIGLVVLWIIKLVLYYWDPHHLHTTQSTPNVQNTSLPKEKVWFQKYNPETGATYFEHQGQPYMDLPDGVDECEVAWMGGHHPFFLARHHLQTSSLRGF